MSTLKGFLQAQERGLRSMEKVSKFSKEITADTTLTKLKLELDNLETAFQVVNDSQLNIEDLGLDKVETHYDKAEDIYRKVKITIREVIDSRTVEQKVTATSPNDENFLKLVESQTKFLEQMKAISTNTPPERESEIKLPKLQIPNFYGDQKAWLSFYDLFKVSIHDNPKLTNAQKLQYLKSYVRGSAASTISNLLTQSEDNYDQAWKKLVDRYHQIDKIVASNVELFVEQPSIKTATASSIRKLVDTCDESLKALDTLKKTERDHFLIYLVLKKLDTESKQLWARIANSQDSPTMEQLFKFLNHRANELELIEPKKSAPPNIRQLHKNVSNHSAKVNDSCILCKQSHPLYRCFSFRNLDVSHRRTCVNENKLCSNCLQKGHSTQQCQSKNVCLVCKQRHHSMLHNHFNNSSVNLNYATPSQSTASTQLVPQFPNITSSLNLNTATDMHLIDSPAISQPGNSSNQQLTSPPANVTVPANQPIRQNDAVAIVSKSQPIQLPQHGASANNQPTQPTKSIGISKDSQSLHIHQTVSSNVPNLSQVSLLPTAIILIKDGQGTFQLCRALLDSGSQSTFISSTCSQRLTTAHAPQKVRKNSHYWFSFFWRGYDQRHGSSSHCFHQQCGVFLFHRCFDSSTTH